MTSIRTIGFKEFEQKLNKLPVNINNRMGAYCYDAIKEWEGKAKRSAPKDQGFLAGKISSGMTSEMSGEVVSPEDYSAYLEWGTKTRVNVPADMQAYAAQFKGGNGRKGAKEMIYDWCKRVGIKKEAWWFVYLSIMIKGVKPHPFFFIHKTEIQNKLNNKVQKYLGTQQ